MIFSLFQIENIAEYYAANYPTELVFKKWKDVPTNKKQKLKDDHAKRKKQHLHNGVLINAKPAEPREATEVEPTWRRPEENSSNRIQSSPPYSSYNDSPDEESKESSEAESEDEVPDPYDSDEAEEILKDRGDERKKEKSPPEKPKQPSPEPTPPLSINVRDLSNVSSNGEDDTKRPPDDMKDAGQADKDKGAESSDWDSDENMDDDGDDPQGKDGDQGQGQGQNDRGRPRYPAGKYEPKKIPKYAPRQDKDREMKKFGYKRGGNWSRLKDHEFEWSDEFKKRQALKVWERIGGAGGGDGGNRARPEG